MSSEDELIKNKVAAYRIIIVQVGFTAAIALLLFMTKGKVHAYSALLGGAASIGPSSFFARCAFKYSAATSPSLVMKWFMVGEAGKLLMTALIFGLSITSVKPLMMPTMFITFLIMTVVNMIGLAILNGRQ